MDKEFFLKLNSQDRRNFEAKLVKDFPNLYADMYGDSTKTCMAWGLDIEVGWRDFVYKLSAKLEKLILLEPEEERKNYRAFQVKQKLGGLRFSMSNSTEEMDMEIDKAEADSVGICETCGQLGKQVGQTWFYVSCKEHAKEEDKYRFEQQEK